MIYWVERLSSPGQNRQFSSKLCQWYVLTMIGQKQKIKGHYLKLMSKGWVLNRKKWGKIKIYTTVFKGQKEFFGLLRKKVVRELKSFPLII